MVSEKIASADIKVTRSFVIGKKLSNMNKIMSYLFLLFDALKGQQIIAQGSALGIWASRDIVRPARNRRGDNI